MVEDEGDGSDAEAGAFLYFLVDVGFGYYCSEVSKVVDDFVVELVDLAVAHFCAFAAIFIAKCWHSFGFYV